MKLLKVVDFKTGREENTAPPDDNLQLMAYGVGAALVREADAFQCVLVFLDGNEATARSSAVYAQAQWWPLLERVKAAATKEPKATPGPHCGMSCYQRTVCPTYRERTALALTLLPEGKEIALTDDQAAQLVIRLQQVREAADLAEDLVKAHVRGGGRVELDGKIYVPTMAKGRRSASVEALEKAGMDQFITQGPPYERWGWRRG